MMKLLFIIVSLIAIISVILNIKLLQERHFTLKKTTYKVAEIIDGDTFRIQINNQDRRVRLMGVNTPEIGKCLSLEAKEKLASLILGKEVTLENQFPDPYGRIMANVFLGNKYINKEMLLSGLGRMEYYENPHREELKIAYEQARARKQGLFNSVCLALTPPVSNETGIVCHIKANVDDNTKKKLYFLPDCRNYSQVTIDLSKDDQWFCRETEAVEAGFAKSPTCDSN